MKLEQLQQVIEVAKSGSLNRAADALYISQPNLSLSLKNLEQELGYAIFSRTNRGMYLTSMGKVFVDYAETILQQINQLTNMSGEMGVREGLHFSLANMTFRYVNDAVSKLCQNHTGDAFVLQVKEGLRDNVIDMVYKDECQIGVVGFYSCHKKILLRQFASKQLQYYRLDSQPISIVVGKGNPLYYLTENEVTSEMLRGHIFLAYDELGFGPYSQIPRMLNITEEYFSRRIYVSNRATIYELLAKTDSFTIMTTNQKAYQHTDYYPDTRYFVMKGITISSEVGWIKRKDYQPNALAMEFISILSSYYA